MSSAIVVYGAGGHGTVLAEMLAAGGRWLSPRGITYTELRSWPR